MKPRVFLDTNVFIFAKEFPDSNSARVIRKLLNENIIEAIISEKVFQETYRYFKEHYGKKISDQMRRYLLESCILIPKEQVGKEIQLYHGKIKDKDLMQLAVVKNLKLKFLVSYDRDFEPFEEYITPKNFLKEVGLKANEEMEY